MNNQIRTVRKLKMVNVYHLFGEGGPMMGVLAYYKDKTINLCNADEGFDELLDQIAKVYAKESLTGEVVADEETKEFLRSINEFPEEEFEGKLKDYRERPNPYFLPKAFSHCYVLPIVRYVIKTLYEIKNGSISIDGEVPPWFGRGNFDIMTNDQAVRLPYQIRMDEREQYEVLVRNVLGVGNSLCIKLHVGPKGFTVSYNDKLFLFNGKLVLRMANGSATLTNKLSGADGVIFDSVTDCEPVKELLPTEATIGLTTGEKNGWTGWSLPWGDSAHACEKDGTLYQVISSKWGQTIVSTAYASQTLTAGDEPERFGKYAFRLYERDGDLELHTLNLDYPGSGKFQERYAGKYYSKEMREGKNGIH